MPRTISFPPFPPAPPAEPTLAERTAFVNVRTLHQRASIAYALMRAALYSYRPPTPGGEEPAWAVWAGLLDKLEAIGIPADALGQVTTLMPEGGALELDDAEAVLLRDAWVARRGQVEPVRAREVLWANAALGADEVAP